MDKDGGEERINDFIFINKNIKYHWDQQWPMFRSLYVSHSHVMETVQCTRHNTIYYYYLTNYEIFHKKVETIIQRNVCCWSLFNQLVVGVCWLLACHMMTVFACHSVTVWQCDTVNNIVVLPQYYCLAMVVRLCDWLCYMTRAGLTVWWGLRTGTTGHHWRSPDVWALMK